MKNLTRLSLFLIGLVTVGSAIGMPNRQRHNGKRRKKKYAGAQAFVAAFDKGDAVASAALWTADGIYVDEDGVRFQGRKSIQQEYETLFQSIPDVRLQMEIDSIRLINADTAIEEGRAAISPQPPGAVRVMSRYTAVHVRQDDRWLMADVRDTRVELPLDVWTAGGSPVAGRYVECHHQRRSGGSELSLDPESAISRTHACRNRVRQRDLRGARDHRCRSVHRAHHVLEFYERRWSCRGDLGVSTKTAGRFNRSA